MADKAEIVIRIALDISERTTYEKLQLLGGVLHRQMLDTVEGVKGHITNSQCTVRKWGEA